MKNVEKEREDAPAVTLEEIGADEANIVKDIEEMENKKDSDNDDSNE